MVLGFVIGPVLTAEHTLHLYTRRLREWRDEHGSETFWARALVQAGPTDAQEAGDFCNEIHPNPTGYGKLAAVWRAALDPLL